MRRAIHDSPSARPVNSSYAITKMIRGGYRAECHHTYRHGGMCDWAEDTYIIEYAFTMLKRHMLAAHGMDRVTMKKALAEG